MDQDITTLLHDAGAGNTEATDQLVRLLYDPLKLIAHRRLLRERSDHTLGTTALVHEAFVKLFDANRQSWEDRAHFLAVASTAMRNVLVDHARSRGAAKRGGDQVAVEYDDDAHGFSPEEAQAVEDLHEALDRLETLSPRQSRLLELRYFGGMKLEECATALGVARATVTRDLRLARAWLACELAGEAGTA